MLRRRLCQALLWWGLSRRRRGRGLAHMLRRSKLCYSILHNGLNGRHLSHIYAWHSGALLWHLLQLLLRLRMLHRQLLHAVLCRCQMSCIGVRVRARRARHWLLLMRWRLRRVRLQWLLAVMLRLLQLVLLLVLLMLVLLRLLMRVDRLGATGLVLIRRSMRDGHSIQLGLLACRRAAVAISTQASAASKIGLPILLPVAAPACVHRLATLL